MTSRDVTTSGRRHRLPSGCAGSETLRSQDPSSDRDALDPRTLADASGDHSFQRAADGNLHPAGDQPATASGSPSRAAVRLGATSAMRAREEQRERREAVVSLSRRSYGWIMVLMVVLALVLGAALYTTTTSSRSTRLPTYTSAYNRVATHDAPLFNKSISDQQARSLANRGAIAVMNPPTPRFDIDQHFSATRLMVHDAARSHHHLQVFDYFNVSYWYDFNEAALLPYSASFKSSWFLRSSSGALIPVNTDRRSGPASKARGLMMDLGNPSLRQWIVTMLTSWMASAPYKGVILDSADPLLPDRARASVANGHASFDTLLCGAQDRQCAAVKQWNAGLTALLKAVSRALHKVEDKVFYNGIGVSPERNRQRSLELLNYTDGTNNESFCYGPPLTHNSKLGYVPVRRDLSIMRLAAVRHKTILETTNYHDDSSTGLANYCAGVFLLGWQPHWTYQTYHRDYVDLDGGKSVTSTDADLNLGSPDQSGYDSHGTVLTRMFHRGLVAVNVGAKRRSVTIGGGVARFAVGKKAVPLQPGSTISIAAHTAEFFLETS